MVKRRKMLRARELRKSSTKVEQILWQYLRNRNFFGKKFRRQYVFLGFILDFYCPEYRLGIELDGSVHLRQKEQDIWRQKIIEEQGIKIIRFSNRDVFSNIKTVLREIKKELTRPLHKGMERAN
jgi:very-short-patch-repair endonuclease